MTPLSRVLLVSAVVVASYLCSGMTSILVDAAMSDSPHLHIRPYQADDQASILAIFEANIREEWSKYHDGKYLPNAERYIQTVLGLDSDLCNIPRVYIEPGGQFWVLVVIDDATDDEKVVGYCGLQVLSATTTEGEIRRNCLLPAY